MSGSLTSSVEKGVWIMGRKLFLSDSSGSPERVDPNLDWDSYEKSLNDISSQEETAAEGSKEPEATRRLSRGRKRNYRE